MTKNRQLNKDHLIYTIFRPVWRCQFTIIGIPIKRYKMLSWVSYFYNGNPSNENYGISIAQISKCTSPISHNAPFCNRNVHMCAHFCYKIVHYGIFVQCIVGFVRWEPSSLGLQNTAVTSVHNQNCSSMGHESADDSLDTFPVNPDEDMQGKGDLLPSLHSYRQCNVNGENYACAILFCKYFTAFLTCGKQSSK